MKKLLPFFLTITLTLSAYTSLSAAEPVVLGTVTWEFRDYGDSWDRSIPLPPSFNGGFDYNEFVVIFTCTLPRNLTMSRDGINLVDFYREHLWFRDIEYGKPITTITDTGFIARRPNHKNDSFYDLIDKNLYLIPGDTYNAKLSISWFIESLTTALEFNLPPAPEGYQNIIAPLWGYDSLEYQWAVTDRPYTDESGRKYRRVIIPWKIYEDSI